MSATCSRGRSAAGAAALNCAFWSPKKSPKMNTASIVAIATTPTFRSVSGAAPASSRPTVTHEPTIRASLLSRPSRIVGRDQRRRQQGHDEHRHPGPRAVRRPAQRERAAGRHQEQRDPGEDVRAGGGRR